MYVHIDSFSFWKNRVGKSIFLTLEIEINNEKPI